MNFFKIESYHEYIPADLAEDILRSAKAYAGIQDLLQIRPHCGLETPESLKFLCELYAELENDLKKILNQRKLDREFVDERVKACYEFNQKVGRKISDPDYKTVIGLQDSNGRTVIGPLGDHYCEENKNAKPVAPIPDFLQGHHITLFGPPDSAKMAINAMNAYHRRLKGEPECVESILSLRKLAPFWGADDEDSKTPMHQDLVDAGVNLSACFSKEIQFTENGKNYQLADSHLSQPLKRFPGLALPTTFLFYRRSPIPLHIYDFALHLFKNWNNPKALAFYVPKLENEEEAKYIHQMVSLAEAKIKVIHSSYKLGSVRLMIVLENPRAILRAHEMMDALYPYFVGASLGWHDYLASTARLFKNDGNYRIPVKADPDIVIKYIKASHELLADVVGTRGGIKVGGMYGILPNSNDLMSDSFQVTIKGFIRDIITQMKRNLTGFWVAHPDFVRLGIALVNAWQERIQGRPEALDQLLKALLRESFYLEIIKFLENDDVKSLDKRDPNYVRALMVADIEESDFIANNHPDEIRYNVFQSLQYITDWLCGNGCVALPALVGGTAVRVMDDLATAERSRWEVWHEVFHKRFDAQDLVRIAFEELRFIRQDLSDEKKIVQVKWNQQTAKWYPVAIYLMLKLMTDRNPAEFASELLMPFTVDSVRDSADPLQVILSKCADKYKLEPEIEKMFYLFEFCGAEGFVNPLSKKSVIKTSDIESVVANFTKSQIIEAASFHGNIGEGQKSLDANASKEQQKVFASDDQQQEAIRAELRKLGAEYLQKFGFKFLVFAQGRSAAELLEVLKKRLTQDEASELKLAKEALASIAVKRYREHLEKHPSSALSNIVDEKLRRVFQRHQIKNMSVAIISDSGIDNLNYGEGEEKAYQIASLSKSIGSVMAIEIFKRHQISLDDNLLDVLKKYNCDIQSIEGPGDSGLLKVRHLMNHEAFNLHYVNGISDQHVMPNVADILNHPEKYKYQPLRVLFNPGTKFSYSGGGFLLLEHLLEKIENDSIHSILAKFMNSCGDLQIMANSHARISGLSHHSGYFDSGEMVPGKYLSFPVLAAGMSATATSMAKFLKHLSMAFKKIEGMPGISHDTAVRALYGRDVGGVQFMAARMGLGVFVAEAGPNKLMLHQGANEGFRALYLHCYDGPQVGLGMVVFANGDNNAVSLIAESAIEILKCYHFEGVDFSRTQKNFNSQGISQEQIVNLGYKALIFDAFEPTLPVKIQRPEVKVFPWASKNILLDAKITHVTNQKFARAENMLSIERPYFDPDLFCSQGKVMDSWETARHNPAGVDYVDLVLPQAKPVAAVFLSTEYHDGNQAQFVRILAKQENHWHEVTGKIKMNGHAWCAFALPKKTSAAQEFRIEMYPDGGLSRVMLFSEVPSQREITGEEKFGDHESHRYSHAIPKSKKPLTIHYQEDKKLIAQNISRAQKIDFASLAFGASLIKATNEHYGPAVQVLSPYPPLHMFDGLESSRSRNPGHFEELHFKLAQSTSIRWIDFDFTFFVNNNPLRIAISGLVNSSWKELVSEISVKEFAGNQMRIELSEVEEIAEIKVKTIPDGGMNRIHIWS